MARTTEALDYNALRRTLKENGPARLYMLWGAEDYLAARFSEEIRRSCLGADSGAFDLKRLEGPTPAVQDVADALEAMPFFGGRTCVELHRVSVNEYKEADAGRLCELFSDIPEWCTVVITLPEGVTPDGRRALTRQIKKSGIALEFAARPENEIFNWLQRRFADQGKRIGRAEMERLVFLSGNLMNRLIPEINKLCTYAQGESITLSDINAVAHHLPEADVFEMTDALAAGNTDRAAALLAELLAGGEEPIMLTAIIGAQMRRLYAVKLSQEKRLGSGWAEQVTGQRSFMIRRLEQTARSFSLRALRENVRLCAQTDYRLKSETSVTAPSALIEELLVRLAMNRSHAAR